MTRLNKIKKKMKNKIKTEELCDCLACDIRAGRLAVCKECKRETPTRNLFDGVCRECKQKALDNMDWKTEVLNYMKMSNGC